MEDEKKSIKPVAMAVLCIIYFVLGVVITDYLEGWDWRTGVYVLLQIITTIGYGDITVQTPAAKLFMSFFVIFTLLIVASILTEGVSYLIALEQERMRTMMRKVETKLRNLNSDEDARARWGAMNEIVTSLVIFLFFVAMGTIFFATYESCTCSYGITAVAGCLEGELCKATGGYTKSWVDSFYMSVITMTTVGFGDHSPKSMWGRVFGCIWMLVGVVATGNLISSVSGSLWTSKKVQDFNNVSKAIFDEIDNDGDGRIQRDELRKYLLLKFGLVALEDLKAIDDLFEVIDSCGDGDGSVTFDEISKYCKLKSKKTQSS
jgi:potassium channel subfamily K